MFIRQGVGEEHHVWGLEDLPAGVVLGGDEDAVLEGLSEGVEVVHLVRLGTGEVEDDDGFPVVHVGHVSDSAGELNSALLKLEIPGQFALASAAFGIVDPGDGTVVRLLGELVDDGLLPGSRLEVGHGGQLLGCLLQSVQSSMVTDEHAGHLEGDSTGPTFTDNFSSSVDVGALTLTRDDAPFFAFFGTGVLLLAVVGGDLGSSAAGLDVAAMREDGFDGGKTLGSLELSVALDVRGGLDVANLELEDQVGAVGVVEVRHDVLVVLRGVVPGEAGIAHLSVEVDDGRHCDRCGLYSDE